MIKQLYLSIQVVVCLILLTGCWDMGDLNYRHYALAAGFDYVDDQYIIYAQLVDFSTIAQQNGSTSGASPDPWVGHAEGSTIHDAMNNLSKTSQQHLDWDQTKVMIFSEAALEKGVSEFLDGFFRFQSVRYDSWIFATSQPVEDILSAKSYFNFSALNSVIQAPTESFRQNTFIEPIQHIEFISDMKEPAKLILLPSVRVSNVNWKKGVEPEPKILMDGIYAIRKGQLMSRFDEHEITGLRLFQKKPGQALVTIMEDDTPIGTVRFQHPKIQTQVLKKNEEPFFRLTFDTRAHIVELKCKVNEPELRSLINEHIEKEIRTTLEKGINKNTDLFMLEYELFQQEPRLWETLTEKGGKPYQLKTDQMDFNINVQLEYEGRFDSQPE